MIGSSLNKLEFLRTMFSETNETIVNVVANPKYATGLLMILGLGLDRYRPFNQSLC